MPKIFSFRKSHSDQEAEKTLWPNQKSHCDEKQVLSTGRNSRRHQKKLQTKTNAIKNLMEAVIENPETKILKCQLFLFMMKHQKDQPF